MITIETKSLERAARIALSVMAARSPRDVYKRCCLKSNGRLSLVSIGPDAGAQVALAATGKAEIDCCVDTATLSRSVVGLPETVDAGLSGTQLVLSAACGNRKLGTSDIAEYPSVEQPKGKPVVVAGSAIKRAIKQALVTECDTIGIKPDGDSLAFFSYSTGGGEFSVVRLKVKCQKSDTAWLPLSSLRALNLIDDSDASLWFSQSLLHIGQGDDSETLIWLRQCERPVGKPADPTKAKDTVEQGSEDEVAIAISPPILANAIAAVAGLCDETKDASVDWEFADGELSLSAGGANGNCLQKVPVEFSGKSSRIFSARGVLGMLRLHESAELRIIVRDAGGKYEKAMLRLEGPDGHIYYRCEIVRH
jgi:hypothetical protein